MSQRRREDVERDRVMRAASAKARADRDAADRKKSEARARELYDEHGFRKERS